MTTVAPHARYTLQEYLRLEKYANIKHEYLAGQIYGHEVPGYRPIASASVRACGPLREDLVE